MTARERLCPYALCWANVEIVPTQLTEMDQDPTGDITGLIKAHDIKNDHLSGPCLASNMYYPLNAMSKKILDDRMRVDAKRIPSMVQQLIDLETQQWTREHRTPPESQSLRGPHRIGREPGMTTSEGQEDWALGGREDEDSGKVQQHAITPPKVPSHVEGHKIGKTVASVSDLIALNTEAALKTGEALAALNEAVDAINVAVNKCREAQGIVVEMSGYHKAALLMERIEILGATISQIEALPAVVVESKSGIILDQEKGEEFVGRLLG